MPTVLYFYCGKPTGVGKEKCRTMIYKDEGFICERCGHKNVDPNFWAECWTD